MEDEQLNIIFAEGIAHLENVTKVVGRGWVYAIYDREKAIEARVPNYLESMDHVLPYLERVHPLPIIRKYARGWQVQIGGTVVRTQLLPTACCIAIMRHEGLLPPQ